MKIRITHEVTDEQRLALSVALTGELSLAARETLESWINTKIQGELTILDAAFTQARDALLENLKL